MLGLGETESELLTTFEALAKPRWTSSPWANTCAPTRHQLPVKRYVPPEEFAALGAKAKALGFSTVYAGPLVRSSSTPTKWPGWKAFRSHEPDQPRRGSTTIAPGSAGQQTQQIPHPVQISASTTGCPTVSPSPVRRGAGLPPG